MDLLLVWFASCVLCRDCGGFDLSIDSIDMGLHGSLWSMSVHGSRVLCSFLHTPYSDCFWMCLLSSLVVGKPGVLSSSASSFSSSPAFFLGSLYCV